METTNQAAGNALTNFEKETPNKYSSINLAIRKVAEWCMAEKYKHGFLIARITGFNPIVMITTQEEIPDSQNDPDRFLFHVAPKGSGLSITEAEIENASIFYLYDWDGYAQVAKMSYRSNTLLEIKEYVAVTGVKKGGTPCC